MQVSILYCSHTRLKNAVLYHSGCWIWNPCAYTNISTLLFCMSKDMERMEL